MSELNFLICDRCGIEGDKQSSPISIWGRIDPEGWTHLYLGDTHWHICPACKLKMAEVLTTILRNPGTPPPTLAPEAPKGKK